MKRKIFSLALASTLVLGSATALAAELTTNVPFINGYEVEGEELNEFRPDSEVKRCEIAKIAAEAYSIAKADPNFPDVDADHWAAQFIGGLQSAKVVEGDPDGNFRPEDSLTRAEFAAIVKRAAEGKLEDKEEEKDFNDTEGHWAEGIIDELSKAEVVKGYEDGSFKPENKVTRAEAVAMVLRSLGREIDPAINSKVNNPFSDVKEGAWYLNDVLGAATEYDYRTDKDGEEEIAVAADTKVISSIEVPGQAFESDAENKEVKVRVNGSTEEYDLNQGKANGYEFKFYQLDKNGDIMDSSDEDYILADADSEDGKLRNDSKKIGDYTIEVRAIKDSAIVARAKGTVTIVDKVAKETEAIKEVEMKTADGVKVKDYTIVLGEEANISKIVADIAGKKDVDIVADGVDYTLESSDEAVVSVADDKTITGETVGKAKLTIKLGDVTKEIEVTVAKDERKPTSMEKVEEVKLVKGGDKTIKVKILDQYGAEVKELTIGSDADDVELVYDEDKLTVVQDPSDKSLLRVIASGDIDDSYTGSVYLKSVDSDDNAIELGSFKVTVGDRVGEGTYKIEAEPGKDLKLDLSKKDDKKVKLFLAEYDNEGKQVESTQLTSDDVTISDEEIASFGEGEDEDYLVGNKEGKVILTVSLNGKTYTAEVEVVSEAKNVTKVTFNDPALNIAKTYKLGDFLSKENIEHNVNSTSDVKVKVEDGVANLYVNEDKIGSIEISGTNIIDPITFVVDGDMDETEIATVDAGEKATVRIAVKDNDDKEIGFKSFNIDVK